MWFHDHSKSHIFSAKSFLTLSCHGLIMLNIKRNFNLDSSNLRTHFAPLSYNQDKSNRTYLTSFQHRHLPIFAVQFHPEKNQL